MMKIPEYDFSEQIKPKMANGSFHKINSEDAAVKFSAKLVSGIKAKIKKNSRGNFKHTIKLFENSFRSFIPTESCSKTVWAIAKLNKYFVSGDFGLKYEVDVTRESLASAIEIDVMGDISSKEIKEACAEVEGWGITNDRDFINFDDLYLDIPEKTYYSEYLMSQV